MLAHFHDACVGRLQLVYTSVCNLHFNAYCFEVSEKFRVVRGAAGGNFYRSPITFDGMVFVPSIDGFTMGWDGI